MTTYFFSLDIMSTTKMDIKNELQHQTQKVSFYMSEDFQEVLNLLDLNNIKIS